MKFIPPPQKFIYHLWLPCNNSGFYLWRSYYVPDSINHIWALIEFILFNTHEQTLWAECYYSHYRDEETEGQQGSLKCPRSYNRSLAKLWSASGFICPQAFKCILYSCHIKFSNLQWIYFFGKKCSAFEETHLKKCIWSPPQSYRDWVHCRQLSFTSQVWNIIIDL